MHYTPHSLSCPLTLYVLCTALWAKLLFPLIVCTVYYLMMLHTIFQSRMTVNSITFEYEGGNTVPECVWERWSPSQGNKRSPLGLWWWSSPGRAAISHPHSLWATECSERPCRRTSKAYPRCLSVEITQTNLNRCQTVWLGNISIPFIVNLCYHTICVSCD